MKNYLFHMFFAAAMVLMILTLIVLVFKIAFFSPHKTGLVQTKTQTKKETPLAVGILMDVTMITVFCKDGG